MKKNFTGVRSIISSKFLVIAIPIALTLGCAQNAHKHPDNRPKPKETFSTEITANGTKFFSYSVEMPERLRMKSDERKQRSGMEKGDRRAESDAAGRGRSTERLHKQLEKKIAETGFCKEGYIVLDEVSGDRYASIRGECRDGADDQENSIVSWQNT